MYKARLNSFGDLVIDGPDCSVNYPTEFTRTVVKYFKNKPRDRRMQKRFIVGVLEDHNTHNVLHEIKLQLQECKNGHRFTVISLVKPTRSKKKDVYVNTRNIPYRNRAVTRIPAEVVCDLEDLQPRTWDIVRPFFEEMI